MNKTEPYEKLKKEISACRLCEEQFGFEPHPIVFGNANSKIMQISQAPSKNVHLTLKPFNDASGKRLRGDWYKIADEVFYNPDNFYIVSIAHCYPGKAPGGGDRLPPQRCAKQWLHREMELVGNKIYLLVGQKAAECFFPKKDFTSLVYKDLFINGKPAYILPHPSPRNIKWFRDNPGFFEDRLYEIRRAIYSALDIKA